MTGGERKSRVRKARCTAGKYPRLSCPWETTRLRNEHPRHHSRQRIRYSVSAVLTGRVLRRVPNFGPYRRSPIVSRPGRAGRASPVTTGPPLPLGSPGASVTRETPKRRPGSRGPGSTPRLGARASYDSFNTILRLASPPRSARGGRDGYPVASRRPTLGRSPSSPATRRNRTVALGAPARGVKLTAGNPVPAALRSHRVGPAGPARWATARPRGQGPHRLQRRWRRPAPLR